MALTFHLSVPCGNIFSWVQKFDLVALTLLVDLVKNFLTLAISFECYVLGL
jgi:hypothetical protein